MSKLKLQILEETFNQSFEIERFKRFTKEFFNEPEMMPLKRSTGIWKEYADYISAYYKIANYEDKEEDNKLIVLAVEINKDKSVERARTIQRNFISKVLDENNYEAAIVAFYSANESNWRLSFVRLDYTFTEKGLNLDLTPARRYSYLVGEGEPSHTAKVQLLPIFENDKLNPTLEQIEIAFSVEKVTKDFFEQYKEKYLQLKEYLEADNSFISETKKLGFEVSKFAEQFSKKLLGQLAFLYFIQKKGWLGVRVLPEDHTLLESEYQKIYHQSDDKHRAVLERVFEKSGIGKRKISPLDLFNLKDHDAELFSDCFVETKYDQPWGNGDKRFISSIFNYCINKTNKNFFDAFLEPLFYEALNKKRKNHYFNLFNCKIPFLNGGLFEPLEGYHWKDVNFSIPNSIFSNEKEKGRNADGVLDIFERYNFTMNEDEPLEKEVAVDPEMLGKIFENLLEVTDRKSKGAYYTPREIVHYMCQESLTNYLVNEVKVPFEDVKEFIQYGELIRDTDSRSGVGYKKGLIIKDTIYKNIVNIDKALENVKVADPAVGSGAYPLGMLSEIVKARNNITDYLVKLDKQGHFGQVFGENWIRKKRSPFRLKWNTIKNSIFAVDIEPSAVDIAKLRLWLSVVVDQEISEETPQPHPLPNLDMNIMVGNSLIDEYEGIKLFDENILKKRNDKIKETENEYAATIDEQLSFLVDYSDDMLEEMFKLQDRYFDEEDENIKRELKVRIDRLRDEVIEYKLQRDGNKDGVKKYIELKKEKQKPYFLWYLEFAKVFKEKGGFDIVIGNPPYGLINKKQNQHTSIYATEIEKQYYKTNPIYSPAKGGMINIYRLFVCLSHNILKEKGNFSLIFPMAFMCDLSASKLRNFLFDNARTLYIEAFPERDNEKKRVFESVKMSVCILGVEKEIPSDNDYFAFRINHDRYVDISEPYTSVSSTALRQIDPVGMTIPLVTQTELDLFIKITKDCKRLAEISKCFTGEIDLSIDKKNITTNEEDTILIRGAQVQKYRITNEISQGDILYLSANNYLDKNNGARANHHKSKRIIMQGITGVNEKIRLKMTLTEPGIFCANSVNYILPNDDYSSLEYILGLLNSKLLNWFFAKLSTNSNVNGYEIDNIPIKLSEKHDDVSLLVTKILDIKKDNPIGDTSSLEIKIDQFVYEIYGLTDDEIKIVEGI